MLLAVAAGAVAAPWVAAWGSGVPVGGTLPPGLHVHWPWPIDRVLRLPVRRVQTVHVGDDTFSFAEGESIHSENSYKYDDATLDALASRAGFRIGKRWTDAKGWFADLLMAVSS